MRVASEEAWCSSASPPRRGVCVLGAWLYTPNKGGSQRLFGRQEAKGKVPQTKGEREGGGRQDRRRRLSTRSPLPFILFLPFFLCTPSLAFAGARAEPRQQPRAARVAEDATALLAQALE